MRRPSRLLAAVLPLALTVPFLAGTASAESPPPEPAAPAVTSTPVTITDLGPLDRWNGIAAGPGHLNEKGEVAASRRMDWIDSHASARLLRAGESQDLHPVLFHGLGANDSWATDVNNAGQVVGTYSFTNERGGTGDSSFVYQNGAATDLGRYGAMAISESGWIAGDDWVRDPEGRFHELGDLGSGWIEAWGINDSGVAVGFGDTDPTSDEDVAAFRSRPGQPLDPAKDRLPSVYEGRAAAFDVNESGVVAGFSPTANGGRVPTLWEADGRQRQLQVGTNGEAHAINDAGTAAGVIFTGEGDRAAVFGEATQVDLNALLPPGSGWVLMRATGINDAGQIAGWGTLDGAVEKRAFLMNLGEGPTVESVTLEQRDVVSGSWTPVDDTGVVDGNKVRVTVAVKNPSKLGTVVTLEVLDQDGVIDDGKKYEAVGPNQTIYRRFTYDTAGQAWEGEGKPRLTPTTLKARLTVGGVLRNTREAEMSVRPRPVILVHGYKSNAASSWRHFHDILKTGHPGLKGWAVGDAQAPGVMRTGDEEKPFEITNLLEQNAGEEARYIQSVREQENAAQVDIVAHSMGGLISRYYVHALMPRGLDGTPVVNRLIMMGTPHRGSPCADLGMDAQAEFGVSPFQPATMQLSTNYLRTVFNPIVTQKRGVVFSNLVGVGQSVPCDWPMPVGDLVVTRPSAEWTLGDIPQTSTNHLLMTESPADFAGYVLPRLSAPPVRGDGSPRLQAEATDEGAVPGAPETAQTPTGFAAVRPTVAAGSSADVPLEVPEGAMFGAVALDSDPAVGLALVDPSGTERTAVAPGSEQAGQPFVGLGVDGHQAGGWTLRVTNTGTAPVEVPVVAWIAGNAVTVEPGAEQADPEGRVRATAKVADEGVGMPGATVTAVLMGERGERVELPLVDDGQSGDGAAGDGTYGATTPDPLADGTWSVVVKADTDQGRRTGRTAVTVGQVDTSSYRLEVSTGKGGQTSVEPAQDSYPAGTKVTIKAEAKPGFLLSGWEVDGKSAGTARELVVTMDRDHEVVARFHTYSVTDLGTTSDVLWHDVYGAALNDRGQVTGVMQVGDPYKPSNRAFRWTDGRMEDLGTLPCEGTDGLASCSTAGRGINNAGTVAGYGNSTSASGGQHAFVAEEGKPLRMLPSLPRASFPWSEGFGINDAGQVHGRSENADERNVNVRWEADGRITPLHGLEALFFGESAMNGKGEVTGYRRTPRPVSFGRRALLWSDGDVRDVALPGNAVDLDECDHSEGRDLSDAGVVVGEYCGDGDGSGVHFRSHDGTAISLGRGRANAVNEAGLVVGSAYDPVLEGEAALWQDGVAHRLEPLSSGVCPPFREGDRMECWYLGEAVDVNERGQILVNGVRLVPNDRTRVHVERALLLTPVTAEADLEVAQTVSAEAAMPGSELTWSTTVTNEGPDPATDVRLSATLPIGVTVSGCTSTHGACGSRDGGRGVVVRELGVGRTATVTVTGTVDPATATATTLTAQGRAYSLAVRDPEGGATATSTTQVGVPLDRGNLNFFQQRVGQTSLPGEVVLTNRGSTPLEVGRLVVPAEFAATTTCSGPVAPGASCGLAVTFTPTAVGERRGVLEVPTTASATPYRVTLFGEAIDGNARPVIGTAGPGSVEGSAPVLSVAFTDADPGDTHTAEVMWSGVSTQPVKATVTASPGGGTVTATAPFVRKDDGPVQALVFVKDSKGDVGIAAVAVPVANAVPEVELGAAVTLEPGQALSRTGSFTDPGDDTWLATADYGTGAQELPLSGKGLTLSHTWQEAGTYVVRVTVTDDDGGVGSRDLQVTVGATNTAPSFALGEPATVAEGTAFSRTVELVDPDRGDTLTARAVIGGVEQELPVQDRKVRLAHTWADDGPQAITLRVSDGRGGTAEQTLAVTVTNAPPTATITGPAAGTVVRPGQSVALAGRLTDPGTADTHTARWTVGDTQLDGTVAGGAVAGSWTPTEPGVYALTLTVTDDDGGNATATTVGGGQALVVVEDLPTSAGRVHVTAGGWFTRVTGCATPVACDAAAGKVSLGLVARTGKGATTGQLQAHLHDTGTRLKATRVASVTATGDRVEVRGVAQADREGELAFLLVAVDAPTGDLVRLKVWDRATGRVLHDSQPGAADDAAPVARMQGSVTLHR